MEASVNNNEAYVPQSQLKIISILTLVYTFNYMDRVVFASVGEVIKHDLILSDLQLGVLGGLAFAAFYAGFGLPLARLAERFNRLAIISVCVTVWSMMTVLCGVAGNFWQLLLFRMGVGIGEAGFTPTVVSLISDYFKPNRRATAYSLIILAVPIGSFIAAAAGGWIAQHYGWRMVFLLIGAPGCLLGLLVWYGLREPPRGHSDGVVDDEPVPPLREVLKYLWAKKTFVHLAVGAAAIGFVAYGNNFFVMSYLKRSFAIDQTQAGLLLGVVLGVPAVIGTLSGGFLSDWAGRRNLKWYAWLPALGLLCSWPIYVFALFQQQPLYTVVFMVLGSLCFYAFLPTTQTVTQGLVRPRMRASTSAINGLLSAVLGLAGGPMFLGFFSDWFAQRALAQALGDVQLGATCHPSALASVGETVATACANASALGVKYAMVAASFGMLWAAVHYLCAARTLTDEIVSPYEGRAD